MLIRDYGQHIERNETTNNIQTNCEDWMYRGDDDNKYRPYYIFLDAYQMVPNYDLNELTHHQRMIEDNKLIDHLRYLIEKQDRKELAIMSGMYAGLLIPVVGAAGLAVGAGFGVKALWKKSKKSYKKYKLKKKKKKQRSMFEDMDYAFPDPPNSQSIGIPSERNSADSNVSTNSRYDSNIDARATLKSKTPPIREDLNSTMRPMNLNSNRRPVDLNSNINYVDLNSNIRYVPKKPRGIIRTVKEKNKRV